MRTRLSGGVAGEERQLSPYADCPFPTHPARLTLLMFGNRTSMFMSAACCLSLFGFSAAGVRGQAVTGEVPHPSQMEAAETNFGLIAHNGREVREVTICSDSLISSARTGDRIRRASQRSD